MKAKDGSFVAQHEHAVVTDDAPLLMTTYQALQSNIGLRSGWALEAWLDRLRPNRTEARKLAQCLPEQD